MSPMHLFRVSTHALRLISQGDVCFTFVVMCLHTGQRAAANVPDVGERSPATITLSNDSPATDNSETLVYYTTRREMMAAIRSKYTRTPFNIVRRCLFHFC